MGIDLTALKAMNGVEVVSLDEIKRGYDEFDLVVSSVQQKNPYVEIEEEEDLESVKRLVTELMEKEALKCGDEVEVVWTNDQIDQSVIQMDEFVWEEKPVDQSVIQMDEFVWEEKKSMEVEMQTFIWSV